jgi:hypothetical protein
MKPELVLSEEKKEQRFWKKIGNYPFFQRRPSFQRCGGTVGFLGFWFRFRLLKSYGSGSDV